MDFMELKEPFLDNMKTFQYFIGLLFVFSSCINSSRTIDAGENDVFLKTKNRILYYKNKPFSGELIAFYDAEKKIKKLNCSYKNGKKNGIENIWYSNGNISTRRGYSNNTKVGIHKGWWGNGNKKFEFELNDFGEYSGTLKEWFENGQLLKEFHYSKGLEEGSQKMWLANGNLRANYVVRNGERFGLIGMKKCDAVSTK